MTVNGLLEFVLAGGRVRRKLRIDRVGLLGHGRDRIRQRVGHPRVATGHLGGEDHLPHRHGQQDHGRRYGDAVRYFVSDISGEARDLATINVVSHGLAHLFTFAEGDLLDVAPTPAGPVDLLLANLPYIPSADVPQLPLAASFEPHGALDGGPDGLDVVRRLLVGLPDVLEVDELASGRRQEGVYAGVTVFAGKLGQMAVLALLPLALRWSGYVQPGPENPNPVQPDPALLTLRLLIAVGPALLLAASMAVAWFYPLTRQRHAEIRRELENRNA